MGRENGSLSFAGGDGGNGGRGGGTITIYAYWLENNGTITSPGENGANGIGDRHASEGCGGGGGGGGSEATAFAYSGDGGAGGDGIAGSDGSITLTEL